MSAALAAVNARSATAQALASLADEFAELKRVRLVAAGKAALGMAQAAVEALGPKLAGGVVTADVPETVRLKPDTTPAADGRSVRLQPDEIRLQPDQIRFFPSSHPLPNDASEAAGRAALALAARTDPRDEMLVVCLSGGASAMLAVPAAGLTLADKRTANQLLLRAGLDIGAMNVVRRHLSGVKGGQLAAASRRTITLAISDVIKPVDDDPLTIGSGPTVGDPTTFADALDIIDAAGLSDAMPAAIMAHLRAGRGGPAAPDDPRLRQSAYWVICSRQDAMRAAAATAKQIGYHVVVQQAAVSGDARNAAGPLLDAARRLPRPACLIASGETTVRVRGQGQGGRNQELCVAALEALHALGPAALASVGTDGIDGPTDAAGALVDSAMWEALGSDAARACAEALDRNDAYPLLDRLGALVKTGPTGTNVCDMQAILLA